MQSVEVLHRNVIAVLESRRAAARLGGKGKLIDAQHPKGRITAREPIDLLLDKRSFEELDLSVEYNCSDRRMPTPVIPG